MNIRSILLRIETNFCLSLHYNQAQSYSFVNGVEIYKFKAKNSKTNAASFSLGNVSEKRLEFMDIFMIFQLTMIILMLTVF